MPRKKRNLPTPKKQTKYLRYSKPIRLVARMCDQGCPEEHDLTPLHIAAFKGQLPKVKKLLKSKKNYVNIRDKFGWIPLHDAAIQGHTEIVKVLIEAGSDLHAQDIEEAYTPLHEAARMNYPAIAKLLLAAGADPSILNAEKITALDIAKDYKFKKIIRLLKDL